MQSFMRKEILQKIKIEKQEQARAKILAIEDHINGKLTGQFFRFVCGKRSITLAKPTSLERISF